MFFRSSSETQETVSIIRLPAGTPAE
jgi:hypothetical protein